MVTLVIVSEWIFFPEWKEQKCSWTQFFVNKNLSSSSVDHNMWPCKPESPKTSSCERVFCGCGVIAFSISLQRFGVSLSQLSCPAVVCPCFFVCVVTQAPMPLCAELICSTSWCLRSQCPSLCLEILTDWSMVSFSSDNVRSYHGPQKSTLSFLHCSVVRPLYSTSCSLRQCQHVV